MINKKNIILLSTIAISAMFTGCGTAIASAQKNEIKNVTVDRTDTDINKPILRDKFEEIVQQDTFVSITTPKSAKQVLEELSALKGSIYFLDKNTENINIPTSAYKVKSFESLKSYIEATTDYTILISQNKYSADMPKIIEVVQKSQAKNSLQNIGIKFWSNNSFGVSASDALSEVAEKTGFTVSTKQDDFDNEQKISNFLTETKINFKGNNVKDFLSYLENSFDLFIDVDYKRKIIYISKYKTEFFKVVPPNIDLSSSTANDTSNTNSSTTTTTGATAAQTQSFQQNVNIKSYESLKQKLQTMFTTKQDSYSYFNLNELNGDLIVKANKSTLSDVATIIKNFNDSYMDDFRLAINVYEVLVSRKNNYGINADALLKGIKNTTISVNTGQASATPFLTAQTNLPNGSNIKTMVDALSTYGYVLSANGIDEMVSNNVPIELSLQSADEYVSSITVDTQTTNGVSTQSVSNTNSTVNSGYAMTVIPRISGEDIYLQIDYSQNKKPTLSDRTIGTNTITLATDYDQTKFKKFTNLKLGDVRLFSVVKYDESDVYKGVVPIEDFILGGNANKSFVRREILVVVQAVRP